MVKAWMVRDPIFVNDARKEKEVRRMEGGMGLYSQVQLPGK